MADSTPSSSRLPEAHDKDDNNERERRIRKRSRPAQIPLRARTFYGCSSIDQYDLGVKLGQGTFGEVKKATHSLTGTEVALKKVTIHEEQDGVPITAIREIKLLKKLNHHSIVAVIDMAYRAPTERGRLGEVFMVEPYMDHDLNGMLENPSIQFTPSQTKLYMKQLFEGTLYLHQNNILHRDMKAANLLINNRGQLQIADFGLARPYQDPGRAWEANGWKGGMQGYTGMVVTRWYRPPELLAGDRRYGPPVDMWGLGCILAEMIMKKPLFQGSTEIDQLDLIARLCGSPNESTFPGWSSLPGVKNAEPDGRPDPEPKRPGRHDFGPYPRHLKSYFTTEVYSVREEMADLLDKLLVLDPCRRMTAKEALEHDWFWQPPFPADPDSLPTYQASKELDRQRRDHQKQQQQQHQQHQNRSAAAHAQMYLQQQPPPHHPHHQQHHHHKQPHHPTAGPPPLGHFSHGQHSNGHSHGGAYNKRSAYGSGQGPYPPSAPSSQGQSRGPTPMMPRNAAGQHRPSYGHSNPPPPAKRPHAPPAYEY